MDEKKIAQIVKDIQSLGLELVKDIPKLILRIKKNPAKDMESLINSFAQGYSLANESKAILIQHLIEVRKVHTLSDDYKKVLKELVKQPSVKVYLQGLLF